MSVRTTAAALTACAALAFTVAGAGSAVAASDNANDNSKPNGTSEFTIALWGDQPYGSAGRGKIADLIKDINTAAPLFTIFNGDIKNGSDPCVQARYDDAVVNFGAVKAPTVYTPGDNEWTDCDRTNNGAYDANERLALIRDMFFVQAKSQGADPLLVARQSEQFPENQRWDFHGVTFVTINVPGTDNNYPETNTANNDPAGLKIDADGVVLCGQVVPEVTCSNRTQNGDLAEYTARNAANLEWLRDSFRWADVHDSKGIMIVQQADMWSAEDKIAHYADEKALLSELVTAAEVPVVLVNGDTHVYATDNPLGLANFTRVTTDGSGKRGWTKTLIDPMSPSVFSFTPITTP